ncbi:MAG: DUF350 domain-containing protein [Candidatus Margulisiibacteriota bacterium]|nr:DUF350 domain-containing protein [Candidatus Margulisiibacteriota bacterium]
MILDDLLKTTSFVFLFFCTLLFSRWIKDLLTPYKINNELIKKDNLAISLSICGYYLGVEIIFIGSLIGPSYGFKEDLTAIFMYSFLGLVFLNLSRYINEKVLLRKFCNIEHLTKKQNVAVGAVQFGTYIATSLIAAGSISGIGGGIVSATVFFSFGQLSLLLFSFIYEKTNGYAIYKELEKQNTAAGVAFSGALIAIGIIILNGVSGDFQSWKNDLINLAIINIIAFIYLPIIRMIVNKLAVSKTTLSLEIVEDRNIGAGLLEASICISSACILKILL